MAYETILVSVDEGIAHVTLNRPDHANAIDAAMAAELRHAAIALRFDPAVRVVLLDAVGKLFSGGGDLQAFRAAGTGAGAVLAATASDLHTALSTLAAGPPVVAAVRGSAGGAGMSLIAGADIVVAGERAKFTMGYTAVALSPDGGSTFFLSRAVGLRRAMDLVLTNRTLDARTAEEWGLVTRVVPDEEVDSAAQSLAAQLAAGSRQSLAAAKRLVLNGANASLAEALAAEAAAISAAAATADGREGVAAFVEKRPPSFGT